MKSLVDMVSGQLPLVFSIWRFGMRAPRCRVSLYQLLADRAGREPDSKVWVYAAGGYYYPGKDISGLQDEFRQYLDLGYTVCKMKDRSG